QEPGEGEIGAERPTIPKVDLLALSDFPLAPVDPSIAQKLLVEPHNPQRIIGAALNRGPADLVRLMFPPVVSDVNRADHRGRPTQQSSPSRSLNCSSRQRSTIFGSHHDADSTIR